MAAAWRWFHRHLNSNYIIADRQARSDLRAHAIIASILDVVLIDGFFELRL